MYGILEPYYQLSNGSIHLDMSYLVLNEVNWNK